MINKIKKITKASLKFSRLCCGPKIDIKIDKIMANPVNPINNPEKPLKMASIRFPNAANIFIYFYFPSKMIEFSFLFFQDLASYFQTHKYNVQPLINYHAIHYLNPKNNSYQFYSSSLFILINEKRQKN